MFSLKCIIYLWNVTVLPEYFFKRIALVGNVSSHRENYYNVIVSVLRQSTNKITERFFFFFLGNYELSHTVIYWYCSSSNDGINRTGRTSAHFYFLRFFSDISVRFLAFSIIHINALINLLTCFDTVHFIPITDTISGLRTMSFVCFCLVLLILYDFVVSELFECDPGATEWLNICFFFIPVTGKYQQNNYRVWTGDPLTYGFRYQSKNPVHSITIINCT